MEKYELLYILAAKYTDAEVVTMMEKIKGMIEAAGGKVGEMHDLGRRKLAYPIDHVKNGSYVLVYFEAETEVLAKLNDAFRLSVDLIRHLIVKKDPYLTKIPSLVEVEPRRSDDDEEAPRPRQMAPRAASAAKEDVSAEDIDKKIDKILTDEVL